MSKHNYSQYSDKKHKNHNNAQVVEPVEFTEPEIKMVVEQSDTAEKPVVDLVEETVETVALPKTVIGIVNNCSKLNVRVAPYISAGVVCVLDAKTEVEIDVSQSTDDWFHVTTAAGIEGYCMRKFVTAHL